LLLYRWELAGDIIGDVSPPPTDVYPRKGGVSPTYGSKPHPNQVCFIEFIPAIRDFL